MGEGESEAGKAIAVLTRAQRCSRKTEDRLLRREYESGHEYDV